MWNQMLRLLAAGLALLAISPDDARADLGLIFDRAQAVPGERVEAFSGQKETGRPSANPPIEGVRVYFVPIELVKRQTDLRSTGLPRDARWLPLGPVRQDQEGVIRMRFSIPRVPPGDYTTGFWCQPCGPPKGDFFTSALPQERWRPLPYRTVIRIGSASRAAAELPRNGPQEGARVNQRNPNIRAVAGILVGLLLVGSSVAAVTLSRRRTSKRDGRPDRSSLSS